MKKIPTLFVRNKDWRVTQETTPGCEWVVADEGICTIKIDGTACLCREGLLFKRYDAKHGKIPPSGFEPCNDPDPITGHWPGWIPVGSGSEDVWYREAQRNSIHILENGTYELIGPQVQSNPYGLPVHQLIRHGELVPEHPPERTFDAIHSWLSHHKQEGLVWHHPEGRMAKIKRRDFGLSWPVTSGLSEVK